jgi:hypothetical protein
MAARSCDSNVAHKNQFSRDQRIYCVAAFSLISCWPLLLAGSVPMPIAIADCGSIGRSD